MTSGYWCRWVLLGASSQMLSADFLPCLYVVEARAPWCFFERGNDSIPSSAVLGLLVS